MSDERKSDSVAIALVIASGILLIAASAPFVPGLSEKDVQFAVSWGVSEPASSSAPTVARGAPTNTSLAIEDVYTASLQLTLADCEDGAVENIDQPAVLSWTVTRLMGTNTTEVSSGSFTGCNDTGTIISLEEHAAPMIETRKVVQGFSDSPEDVHDEAKQNLWSVVREENETATYVLSFSWQRDAGLLDDLPLRDPPGYTATLLLEHRHWLAALNQIMTPEVVR